MREYLGTSRSLFNKTLKAFESSAEDPKNKCLLPPASSRGSLTNVPTTHLKSQKEAVPVLNIRT